MTRRAYCSFFFFSFGSTTLHSGSRICYQGNPPRLRRVSDAAPDPGKACQQDSSHTGPDAERTGKSLQAGLIRRRCAPHYLAKPGVRQRRPPSPSENDPRTAPKERAIANG